MKAKRLNQATPISCSKCGVAGGTLVKDDGGYVHQDTSKCRLLQLRRR